MGHRMFRKRTADNLDDPVVFDDAVADLLPCLEATPFHKFILSHCYFIAYVHMVLSSCVGLLS